jgi:signal transduction histidine kinase
MNRRHFSNIIIGTALALTFSGFAVAQERGTFDEAKALVNKGLAHVKKVGNEAAFKDFTEDKANWTNKDIYIFALDMKGNQVAHGFNTKQIGKNFWEFRDAGGKLAIQEFTAAAAKGTGIVEYYWAHPTSKKVEPKVAYIARITGTDYYIGAGAYK